MTGRWRYALAAFFVALFCLMPAEDHDYLAFLKTKAWLTKEAVTLPGSDDAKAPFEHALVGKRLPPLVATTGRLDDRDQDRIRDFERLPAEWVHSEENRKRDLILDRSLPPMRLHVKVGDKGFLAILHLESTGKTYEIRKEVLRTGKPGEEYYPDIWSLTPPFLAIVLAILTGKIIPSLLLGCLAGAILFSAGPFTGLWFLFKETIWQRVLLDTFSLRIMGFVVFLFMTVGIMTRAGGVQGFVEWIRRYAKGPVSSQLCSYIIGLLIFFDDYTNCVLTGTTMRPLTDRNRVSREKLAYIVDSTAAPIAGISIFSTWVAYEISQFAPQLPLVGKSTDEGFSVFLDTLPVRFYCLFTLVLVVLTILMRREFGTMLQAERRAIREGKPLADDAQPMISEGFNKLEAPEGTPHRARNAVIPIGLLVVLTLTLIFWIGYKNTDPIELEGRFFEDVRAVLKHTQSEWALVISSFVALLVAGSLAIGQRILSVKETVNSALRSAHSLGFAVVILILAWSIGRTCGDVGTNEFLIAAFHRGFPPWLLPVVMFALASLVAFCTGTSYGTMAILLPNIVVLAYTMGEKPEAAYLGGYALMVLTIGAVLEGSIFGDHCSPISDTTVLSSVATGSDHLHHVRTQAPYAVFGMVVSMLCGYIPVALLGPDYWPLAWVMGIGVLVIWLLVVGRRPE